MDGNAVWPPLPAEDIEANVIYLEQGQASPALTPDCVATYSWDTSVRDLARDLEHGTCTPCRLEHLLVVLRLDSPPVTDQAPAAGPSDSGPAIDPPEPLSPTADAVCSAI